jgi:hypothetical protein
VKSQGTSPIFVNTVHSLPTAREGKKKGRAKQPARKKERPPRHHSVFSKTISSAPVFVSFLLPVFFILENRSVLFETCTFVNILRNLNFNQPNDADLRNFLD